MLRCARNGVSIKQAHRRRNSHVPDGRFMGNRIRIRSSSGEIHRLTAAARHLGFYCLIEPVVFIADYRKGPEGHFPPVPLHHPIFG